MDLESTNGTLLNGEQIEPARYIEMKVTASLNAHNVLLAVKLPCPHVFPLDACCSIHQFPPVNSKRRKQYNIYVCPRSNLGSYCRFSRPFLRADRENEACMFCMQLC